MRIYLAGPIAGQTYKGAVEWREEYAAQLHQLGHTAVSPMRGKEHLKRVRKFTTEGYEQHPVSSQKGVYGRDCFDVRTCDVLFARLLGADQVSIGTCMEIQRAHDHGKYILVLMEPNNIHSHIFVKEACSLIVETDEEALEVLAVLGAGYVDHMPEVSEPGQEPD